MSAYNRLLKEKIEYRLNSIDWDSMIAGNVIARRKKKNRIIGGTAISSLAIIIITAFAIFTGITPHPDVNIDQFITHQLDGTYKSAFKKKYNLASQNTAISFEDIDSIIDDTMSKR